MAEESRAVQFISDHLYVYTDNPKHILLDMQGKPQEARFQMNNHLKEVLNDRELGNVVKLRQHLSSYENGNMQDEDLIPALIELFPTLGSYDDIIPDKSRENNRKNTAEKQEQGKQPEKEEPAKNEGKEQQGDKTPNKASKKQTDWIETMMHNRQLTVQEVGKPLSELTADEASKLITLGKDRPIQKGSNGRESKPTEETKQPPANKPQTAKEAYTLHDSRKPENENISDPAMPAIRQEHGLVIPDVDQAVAVMAAFQDMKARLLTKDDIMTRGDRSYAKKSGCRKYALAFRISLKTVRIEREYAPNGDKIARVYAQAIMPDGVVIDGYGVCDSETVKASKMPDSWHNVESKAQTRAYNRATLDAIGGGEVSADEIE